MSVRIENDFARAFCVFVAAAVAIIFLASLVYFIAANTIVTPTPMQAAKEANLIGWGIVRRESLSNE